MCAMISSMFDNNQFYNKLIIYCSEGKKEAYNYFKSKLTEVRPEYAAKFQEFEDSVDEMFVDFDDIKFWGPYVVMLW